MGDGLYAYVDAADFEWLNQWTWHLHGGYAVAIGEEEDDLHAPRDHEAAQGEDRGSQEPQQAGQHAGESADLHAQENACNRSKKTRHVLPVHGRQLLQGIVDKWYARICDPGETPYDSGYFVEEVDAARAYDRKAVELAGEFARLNFPEEWPPERIREVHAKRPARKNGKRSTERVLSHSKKDRGQQNHGRDARATKRPKAGHKKKPNGRPRGGLETRPYPRKSARTLHLVSVQIFGQAGLLWPRMLFCVEGVPPSNRGQDARDTNRSHTLLSVRLPEFFHRPVTCGEPFWA